MNCFERLKYEREICCKHETRLQFALTRTQHLYPFTLEKIEHLNEEELGILDSLLIRFSKLQDTLGEKVFPLLLECLGERVDSMSFIDKLNKLEKLEILPSAQWWKNLRVIRNALTHEYPDNPEFMVKILNETVAEAKSLINFWYTLMDYIDTKVKDS